MHSVLSQLVVLAAAASSTFAADAVYTLNLANTQVAPDGVSKTAITVNGQIDGPLLTANKGDNFKITVNDNNSIGRPTFLKPTSIHWHGFFQDRTAAQDGPAGVTQCPIAAGNSFTYQFSTGAQAGTFWYHSHYGAQYCDGLRGSIVVYDPNDPFKSMYDVDDATTVITLSDWYANPSLQSFPDTTPRPAVPSAVSMLINGKGRRLNSTADLSVVNVTQGKRYRFRLIHTGCLPNFQFWIEGHQMTVIEADGIEHQPLTVDSLQIFIGQRYSVVVNANQTVANYWIRILPNVSPNPANFTNNVNSAVLRYAGAPNALPTTQAFTPSGPNALVEANLHPLVNPGAPTAPDADIQKFNLVITRDTTTNNFSINGVSFVPPTVPVLLQILNGVPAQNLLPVGSVFEVDKGKIVEVSIPGGAPGNPHPFHLHGHAFDVIRTTNMTGTNLVNPPRRDVVSTGIAGDNTTIRFATDNPGPWIFHCHIDWHLDAGLAIVFAERVPEQTNGSLSQQHGADWDQLCPIFNALDPNNQ